MSQHTYFYALLLALVAPQAQANYMAYCQSVIDRWSSCGSNMGVCLAAEAALNAHCKCHRLNNAEDGWVVISGTLSSDGICGRIPNMTLKTPPKPPGNDPKKWPVDGTPDDDLTGLPDPLEFTPPWLLGGSAAPPPDGTRQGGAAAGAEAVGRAVGQATDN